MNNPFLPEERLIIAHTLFAKAMNEQFGFVQPVAELIDGKLSPISKDNFCSTMRVFITSNYEELPKAFPERKLFLLKIRLSGKISENASPEETCKYVSTFSDAQALKPKDYYEIISAELPNANDRVVVVDQLPGTQYIFIKDEKYIYGPFKWSKSSNKENSSIDVEFIDAPLPSVSLMSYQTYKIDINYAEPHLVEFSKRNIVQGLSVLLNNAGYLDYSSDEEIVRYCAKIANDKGLRMIERSRLDAFASAIRKLPKMDNEFIKNRLSRMLKIAELSTSVQEDVAKSMSSFLQNEGNGIVQRFIESNEAIYLERIKNERAEQINSQLVDLNKELVKAENRLTELNSQKNLLNEDIQNLKAEQDRGADLQHVYAESDEIIKKKNGEIVELEKKISALVSEHNLMQNIAQLKEDVKYYERKREEEKDRAEQAREVTKELSAKMQETNTGLQKRMADLKPFVEAINGSFASEDICNEVVYVPTSKSNSTKSLLARQNDVVQSIRNGLISKGRPFELNQVANLLITLQQSFITIFAGLPGVGKTSLARLFADVQNIKPRFREIPVSRGWTSQKDLIGYFNPLTCRFQPANTGLYSFLKAICTEDLKEPNKAMSFILLDEANLSPIEHYWSAFMGLSDNEREREIILGSESIIIPEHLRFIATINYDGTTEPLSPRLINRAPVLVIDSSKSLINSPQSISEEIENNLPIAADQMKELFGLSVKAPELGPEERPVYETIKRILLDNDPALGRPVSISPRKENAIHQYCGKARGLMTVDNDLLALDFAIQQHILPLIQGNGVRFGKRLEKLRAELVSHGLSESERVLSRMITFGEADLQTYDFFCW